MVGPIYRTSPYLTLTWSSEALLRIHSSNSILDLSPCTPLAGRFANKGGEGAETTHDHRMGSLRLRSRTKECENVNSPTSFVSTKIKTIGHKSTNRSLLKRKIWSMVTLVDPIWSGTRLSFTYLWRWRDWHHHSFLVPRNWIDIYSSAGSHLTSELKDMVIRLAFFPWNWLASWLPFLTLSFST